MKKLIALLLCLLLALSCVATLASCDSDKTEETTTKNETTTAAPSEETTEATEETSEAEETTEATEETTEATEETSDSTDESGDASDETQDVIDDTEYDPELYVVIRNAEDLMAFNKAVNEDYEYFDGMTIVFTADIDMTGYVWTPLDGTCIMGVTFEGNNHTISNLQFADYEYEVGMAPPNGEKGCGFVGSACSDITFLNLTFLNTTVNAYDQAVGNFLGSIRTGSAWFENCKSIGFTVNGWMDWNNQDRENDGHAIAMREAGFIGHIVGGGSASFTDCAVENITLTGFHNLAGFVGYDGGGMLDAFCFENCTVTNANFTFSYCLSENYTVDMPRKFVSVFYNSGNWADNIDDCLDMGNDYLDVYFFDYTDNNAEYSPVDFRSWTQEEAAAG